MSKLLELKEARISLFVEKKKAEQILIQFPQKLELINKQIVQESNKGVGKRIKSVKF